MSTWIETRKSDRFLETSHNSALKSQVATRQMQRANGRFAWCMVLCAAGAGAVSRSPRLGGRMNGHRRPRAPAPATRFVNECPHRRVPRRSRSVANDTAFGTRAHVPVSNSDRSNLYASFVVSFSPKNKSGTLAYPVNTERHKNGVASAV